MFFIISPSTLGGLMSKRSQDLCLVLLLFLGECQTPPQKHLLAAHWVEMDGVRTGVKERGAICSLLSFCARSCRRNPNLWRRHAKTRKRSRDPINETCTEVRKLVSQVSLFVPLISIIFSSVISFLMCLIDLRLCLLFSRVLKE